MDLYRFGASAIRLEQVVSIKSLDAGGPDGPARVRVYFQGQRAVVFEGADAESIRDFVSSLPAPRSEAPPGAPEATVVPKLDPRTGRPSPRPADRVTGA